MPLVGQYSQKTDKFYADHGQKTLCLAFYTVDWTFDHRDGKFRLQMTFIISENYTYIEFQEKVLYEPSTAALNNRD